MSKIFCFDIDNTICFTRGNDYEDSKPWKKMVEAINELHKAGNTIKIFTARGSHSGKDWKDFTKKQLDSWGLRYDELIFGKPHADVYIDDKSIDDFMFESLFSEGIYD